MKIGLVIIANGFAGAENVLYSLAKELSLKNKDIELIMNDQLVSYYENLKDIKIKKIGTFSSKNIFSLTKSLLTLDFNLEKIIKSENYDIVGLHSNTPFLIYNRSLSKENTLAVPTLHGTDVYDFINCKRPLYLLFMKPRIKKLFSKVSKITSVSHHQIQNLDERYKKKTVVIPNGVDSKLFRPIKSINPKKNVVLFAGRFIDIKGVRELVAVAKQLPQYEFWFAGQGPFENLLNGKNIKNLGFKDSKQLVDLYNEATICTFPSYREGFPLIGLEAMACGKPVIATPLGFSEYMGNGKDGIIIPARDENALKNAIVRLMEDPKLRQRLGKAARKKAEKYSWEKVAKQYYELFEKVISENKNKSNSS